MAKITTKRKKEILAKFHFEDLREKCEEVLKSKMRKEKKSLQLRVLSDMDDHLLLISHMDKSITSVATVPEEVIDFMQKHQCDLYTAYRICKGVFK